MIAGSRMSVAPHLQGRTAVRPLGDLPWPNVEGPERLLPRPRHRRQLPGRPHLLRLTRAGHGAQAVLVHGIAIFGSPSLTVSLIELCLVDGLRVLVNPIVLGDGRSLFRDRLRLELLQTRTFRSGNVLLTYRPA
jgi:RibD C-terminal domain